MNFTLVDSGWDHHLETAVRSKPASIRIISPFIKTAAAARLLKHGTPDELQVITRFSLDDFFEGVSDIAALQMLMARGARIRGIRNLHSKLYLFGDTHTILTSANLTESGFTRNHEFGFVAEDRAIVKECRHYFEDLWDRAGLDLSLDQLGRWEQTVATHRASGNHPAPRTGLGDFGAELGFAPPPLPLPTRVADAPQAFVKFFGEGHNRADHLTRVADDVRRSGSHQACTYPLRKRPRSVRDGAVMFMGRLVRRPNDVMIYGRAIGMAHVEGQDEATAAEIELRDWRARWPNYVRVHHPEFVDGALSDGVSLNELMDALGSDAFTATQRNAASGIGNTNPRRAFQQQAAVELSSRAFAWLNERLTHTFERHGTIAPARLAVLDDELREIQRTPRP